MKKLITLLLALALILSPGAPCFAAPPRTVTDGLGREVEVPADAQRIVTLGNATRMLVYLGLADRLIATANGDMNDRPYMAYGAYYQDAWARLPVAASGSYGEVNTELILELDPDLILCTYEAEIVESLEAQLGRRVVAAPQGKLFDADFERALRIFGEACGVSARAEAVIACIHANLDELDARTAGIPEQDKPLCLSAASSSRVMHGIGGVYADSAILSAVHARDAAAGLGGGRPKGVEVDREQILLWDPDVLFLDAGNLGLIRQEYAEDPAFFDELRAVQSAQVYQWPNASANYTNVEIPLVSAWFVGCLLYPDAFADVDFEAKAEEIFSFFLGRSGYLGLLDEAGLGYARVSLSEQEPRS